ncbi:MAG: flavoprotein [Bacillota bacterium]|nr:flavoprotein [Bacillota bacterium]
MNIEELVKNMLQTIVPNLNKRILIFLTGGTVNAEILLNILADYDEHQYDIVISENGKESLSEAAVGGLKGKRLNSFSELKDALKKADFILIPVMTRNTLAKAALGIEDNLVTTGIARALMSNKEVFAVKDSFSSEHPINKAMDLAHNAAYNAMLKSYEYQLETFVLK